MNKIFSDDELRAFEKYYKFSANLEVSSAMTEGITVEGLSNLLAGDLNPELDQRLSELFMSESTFAADLGLGTWKTRLLALNEEDRVEIEKLSTSLADQLDLLVEISGSDQAIESNLVALQNIEPEKIEETLIKLLTPKSNAQIGKTAAFGFLLMLQREEGDGNEWLLAAATLDKVIAREARNIALDIKTHREPENVAKILGHIFKPQYLSNDSENSSAQVMISLVSKSQT